MDSTGTVHAINAKGRSSKLRVVRYRYRLLFLGGAAARRVLRAKKGPEPFWNPIPYGAKRRPALVCWSLAPAPQAAGMPSFQRQCGGRSALMRINIWIILGTLLALLSITRYMQHEEDQRICVDDPTASVCHR